MLDFIGTVVISAVMVVNINAIISTMPGIGEPLESGHRLRSMDRTGGRNGKCRVAGASAAGHASRRRPGRLAGVALVAGPNGASSVLSDNAWGDRPAIAPAGNKGPPNRRAAVTGIA